MARQNEEKRAEIDQKISILQEMIRIIEKK